MELYLDWIELQGRLLVFPSSAGGTTSISIQKVWRKVRAMADLDDLRLHDLRHNFYNAVSSGQSLYMVGKLLGQCQTTTTQRLCPLCTRPGSPSCRRCFDKVGGEDLGKDRGGGADLELPHRFIAI